MVKHNLHPVAASAKSAGPLQLPLPGMGNDGRQIRIARLPAQLRLRQTRIGHQTGWITGPPWTISHGDITAGYLPCGFDNLLYREAAAIAQVIADTVASSSKLVQRQQVCVT